MRLCSALAIAAGALCAAGCGSPPPATPTATPRVGGADTPLERALLAQRNPGHGRAGHGALPRSDGRRARGDPFGNTRRLMSCDVRFEAPDGTAVSGRYDVQVLRNGCFVAEREKRRPRLAQAIYGCGVKP